MAVSSLVNDTIIIANGIVAVACDSNAAMTSDDACNYNTGATISIDVAKCNNNAIISTISIDVAKCNNNAIISIEVASYSVSRTDNTSTRDNNPIVEVVSYRTDNTTTRDDKNTTFTIDVASSFTVT